MSYVQTRKCQCRETRVCIFLNQPSGLHSEEPLNVLVPQTGSAPDTTPTGLAAVRKVSCWDKAQSFQQESLSYSLEWGNLELVTSYILHWSISPL